MSRLSKILTILLKYGDDLPESGEGILYLSTTNPLEMSPRHLELLELYGAYFDVEEYSWCLCL